MCIGMPSVLTMISVPSPHTAAIVQWNDPSDFYRLKPEYVEDAVGVARYGLRKKDIVAFGTASQGQAHRVGKWLLFTERYESEIVSFVTGLDAAYVRPGQIAKIVDPGRSTSRFGGRVVLATANTVTIDAPITVPVGSTVLTVMMPDGTLLDRSITNAPGVTSVLTFATALPSTDIKQALWVVGTPSVTPELIRVLSISEEAENTYRVTGLAHYPGKYAEVELGLKLQPPRISDLRAIPDAVVNLAGSEYLYRYGGSVFTRLVISFEASPSATTYSVSYRRTTNGQDNWHTLPVNSHTHVEVDDVVPDTYEFEVVAINGLGIRSLASTATYTVLGKAGAPPANVTGFTATTSPQQLQLAWNDVPDLDLAGYELREGASPQMAIHTGYERAWATILDSNVTTLIAGLALLAFGSGPVRGFAVVHVLGILTSMFSAVFFSRGLVNLWYGGKKKLKSLAIGQIWKPEATGTSVASVK